MLVAEGELDPERRVAEYVPELAGAAFGDATVRQVMDMTTGIRFREDYADPTAEVWARGPARCGPACVWSRVASRRPRCSGVAPIERRVGTRPAGSAHSRRCWSRGPRVVGGDRVRRFGGRDEPSGNTNSWP